MSNMHRIMWFDSQIRENKYPNRNALAERFEISIRQAQRDIDYLKDSLSAPLRYDAKKRGYFYEEKTFVLPNVYINEEQKRLLSFLTYSYENYNQSPKVEKIVELFKRFSGDENSEEDIPIFDLNKSITETLYILADSIKKRRKVRVKYRDPHKGEIDITVHPYKIYNKYRVDQLYAFSEEISDYTTLRIDRMLSLNTIEETFDTDLETINRSSIEMLEKSPYIAKIKFSKEPEFIDRSTIRVFEVEDLIYQVHFFQIEELINQLLSIDYWEEIYEPKWLKEKLKERCSTMITKLDDKV